jgi:hypothetical protein
LDKVSKGQIVGIRVGVGIAIAIIAIAAIAGCYVVIKKPANMGQTAGYSEISSLETRG